MDETWEEEEEERRRRYSTPDSDKPLRTWEEDAVFDRAARRRRAAVAFDDKLDCLEFGRRDCSTGRKRRRRIRNKRSRSARRRRRRRETDGLRTKTARN